MYDELFLGTLGVDSLLPRLLKSKTEGETPSKRPPLYIGDPTYHCSKSKT